LNLLLAAWEPSRFLGPNLAFLAYIRRLFCRNFSAIRHSETQACCTSSTAVFELVFVARLSILHTDASNRL
jgi:hypothetical protein